MGPNENYLATKFYRVSNNGTVVEKKTWEEIQALPKGLFYIELITDKHETTSFLNLHIFKSSRIYNYDKELYTPKINGFYILEIKGFLNTANSPQILSSITIKFENENGDGWTIQSKGYINSGLKEIFSELEVLNDKYKGSFMEYIIGESNTGFIKLRDNTFIEIVKRRI